MTNQLICVVNDTALPNRHLLTEHGLAFWIETETGIALFDTGQTGKVISKNMEILGLDPADIQALALSHAHYDHTGGLEYILAKNSSLAIYAHPAIFRPRFSKKRGQYKSIGMALSREYVESRAKLNLSGVPVQVIPGLWTTGEIFKRPELEGRSNHHYLQAGQDWQADDYKDDMSLVLDVKDDIVLICGCCHAGLLNTLFHVKRTFKKPLRAVVGGTHLLSADGQYLRHVVDVISDQFPGLNFFLNHCSGETAIQKLKEVFGDRVVDYPAGTLIDSEDFFGI